MAFPNDLLASHIASQAGGFEPQRDGAGVLQVNFPPDAQGDLTTLMLAVKGWNLPVRTMGQATIPYLAGYAKVPTKPDEPGDLTVTVHDYVDVQVYDMLHRWSKLVHDLTTGFTGFSSQIKSSGILVYFGPDGSLEREWRLIGLWPNTLIPARVTDYENNNPVTLEYTFVLDNYIFEDGA